MSAKERMRLQVLAEIRSGCMTLSQAALKLGMSYRQMRRVHQRHKSEGDVGVVHRLRGRCSNRRTDASVREQVMASCQEKYLGFGPTLVSEYLAELDEPVLLSHDTIRRWLLEAGLMSRRRCRSKHRSRRERRSRCGSMVQMDGSWHDWFEGRGSWCCLMVMIDDATGQVLARFYDRETLAAAFDLFERYAAAQGLPVSLYVDRAGIYRSDKEPTLEQELNGERPLTQFGRAMKSMDVELILANSPQAKGRVERVNGTLQDRLVKAMRLAGISDIAAANRYLDETFLASFNQKFAIEPAEALDAHRATELDLQQVLCEHHHRKVARDWCVQWQGKLLQIDKQHQGLNLPGKSIELRELANGAIQMMWQHQRLEHHQLIHRPGIKKPKPKIVNNQQWKPPASHPWKAALATREKLFALPAPHGGPAEQRQEQGTILLR